MCMFTLLAAQVWCQTNLRGGPANTRCSSPHTVQVHITLLGSVGNFVKWRWVNHGTPFNATCKHDHHGIGPDEDQGSSLRQTSATDIQLGRVIPCYSRGNDSEL
eukprot:scpid41594/ scgid20260/ 